MTNLEALRLQSTIIKSIPDDVLEFQLSSNDLTGSGTYEKDNLKSIELSFAGLLLFVATQPQSVKELDYQITNVSAGDLLAIRSGILRKYGIPDNMSPFRDNITNATNLW